MLKIFFHAFFLFIALSVHGWQFENTISLEGDLKRAERTIISTDPNGESEARVERSIVLVTDTPLILTHSVTLANQQLSSTETFHPHIEVYLSKEFIPLIGKRVRCIGTFRKNFDSLRDEIIFDVDTALDCEQPQLKTVFYEPEEVEVTGTLYETTYPGPPEYMSVEMGDRPEEVVILTLKEPMNVGIKGGGEDDDFNEAERGVRELQVVFSDPMPSIEQMKEEIVLKGTLYHAHTAHHRRRILISVNSWKVK
jgi:hypothetical protein